MGLALAAAIALAGTPTSDHMPHDAEIFIKDHLKLTQYDAALVDLNDDGVPEVLVYARAPSDCGTGGCDLFILQRQSGTYRVVTDIGPAHPPIRILSTTSHGWHDLGVLVAGGGIIRGYEAQLTFDRNSYPENPTVPPAKPLRKAVGRVILE